MLTKFQDFNEFCQNITSNAYKKKPSLFIFKVLNCYNKNSRRTLYLIFKLFFIIDIYRKNTKKNQNCKCLLLIVQKDFNVHESVHILLIYNIIYCNGCYYGDIVVFKTVSN